MSSGHTETPRPWKHCGLVILWAPSLVQGAECLCPGPAAPDGDSCGGRKTSASCVTPPSRCCFFLAAPEQVSSNDPAHRRKVAGDRKRMENGKDQDLPEGEGLKPVWLVWCPWAPAPCPAPALKEPWSKKTMLGEREARSHRKSPAQPVKARAAS